MRTILFSALVLLSIALASVGLVACDQILGSDPATATKTRAEFDKIQVAAEAGNPDAQFQLGVRFHLGNGVSKDPVRAAYWYEKAALSGHVGAMKNLAALYYEGNGVDQDYQRALDLYKRATDLGDVGAQASLAGLYLDGRGTARNYGEAIRLYKDAAQRNYPYAQTAVGLMYKFGWGVEPDPIEAVAWWVVASRNGDNLATDNLDQIKPSLAPEELQRGYARAKEIKANLVSKSPIGGSRTDPNRGNP